MQRPRLLYQSEISHSLFQRSLLDIVSHAISQHAISQLDIYGQGLHGSAMLGDDSQ